MFQNNAQVGGSLFDITDVGHIERLVVGSTDPSSLPGEEEIQQRMALINRCLSDHPKGRIIGVERSFSVVRIGEHQVVLEAVVYHIGFRKRPLWLSETTRQQRQFHVDTGKLESLIQQQHGG